MRRNHRLVVAATLAVMLSAREAGADDIVWLKSPSTVTTDGGTTLRLPPGYFVDEPTWQERDFEFRRLQELETRLEAENRELRADASKDRWMVYVAVATVGALVGGGLVAWQLK